MSSSKPGKVLIIDSNLLARKSYYKFIKLNSEVTIPELSMLSPNLGKILEEEVLKKVRIISEEEENIQEILSKGSGKKLAVSQNGRIDRNLKKFSINSERFPVPTGTLYGMLRSIIAACNKYDIDKIVMCYDPIGVKKEPQFRNAKTKTYKDRKKDPIHEERFFESLELAMAFFYNIGMLQVTSDKYEADDIIHFFTHRALKNRECYVLTNDHDMYQVLEEGRVSLLKINTAIPIYTAETFREEHQGLPASKYRDVLTLAGCSTDHVQGIKGLGPTSAIKLIKKFKTIKKMLKEYKDSDIEPRLKNLLDKEVRANLKNIKLSRVLVSLYGLDEDLKKNLRMFRLKTDPEKRLKRAETFFKILKFNSFLTKSSIEDLSRIIEKQK